MSTTNELLVTADLYCSEMHENIRNRLRESVKRGQTTGPGALRSCLFYRSDVALSLVEPVEVLDVSPAWRVTKLVEEGEDFEEALAAANRFTTDTMCGTWPNAYGRGIGPMLLPEAADVVIDLLAGALFFGSGEEKDQRVGALKRHLEEELGLKLGDESNEQLEMWDRLGPRSFAHLCAIYALSEMGPPPGAPAVLPGCWVPMQYLLLSWRRAHDELQKILEDEMHELAALTNGAKPDAAMDTTCVALTRTAMALSQLQTEVVVPIPITGEQLQLQDAIDNFTSRLLSTLEQACDYMPPFGNIGARAAADILARARERVEAKKSIRQRWLEVVEEMLVAPAMDSE